MTTPLTWPTGWRAWDNDTLIQAADGGRYRIARTTKLAGMPYIATTPTGRPKRLYLACRRDGGQYSLLSVHGSAVAARKACQRDADNGSSWGR